jgi:hypothetical protein
MELPEVSYMGTLLPDGTLEFDEKPNLPPGRVVVQMQPRPIERRPPLTVANLNAFLRSLPSLGDDADTFARDVRNVRESFPRETSSWE